MPSRSMPRLASALVAALLASLAAVGCSRSVSAPEDEGEPVSFQRLDGFFPAVYSGLTEAENLVIRTREDWNTFWDRFQPGNQRVAPPAVDFQERVVLVVALGTRSTGGYLARIHEVLEVEGGALRVEATESIPGGTCGTTQALTQPADAVLVPRSEARVRFEVEDRVYECDADDEEGD